MKSLEAIHSKKGKIIFVCIIALSLIFCATSGIALLARRIKLQSSWTHLQNVYPSLVFQRLTFSKYIVQGTVPETNSHFAKLDIYLVQGSADLQCKLDSFVIDKVQTNWFKKILVLKSNTNEEFITTAQVHIKPEGLIFVDSVIPEEFSDEEISMLKKNVALGAGVMGAGVGAFAGLNADKSFKSVVPGLSLTGYSGGISALLGAAAAGGLASGAVYLFTNSVIAKLQSESKKPAQMQDLLLAVEPLIMQDILGDSYAERVDTERDYRKQFESRMQVVAREFGWNKVVIQGISKN